MKRSSLLVIPALLAGLSGCVVMDPNAVNYQETRRLNSVQEATVLSVRPVTVEAGTSGAGAMTGSMIGSMAGASMGGYRDSFIGSILGAVAGAVVGNEVERSANRRAAVELTLQLRNGDRRMIVQGQGNEYFQPGDPVVVISDGYHARVTHATVNAPVRGAAPPVAAPAAAPAPPPTPAPTPDGRPAPIYTPR